MYRCDVEADTQKSGSTNHGMYCINVRYSDGKLYPKVVQMFLKVLALKGLTLSSSSLNA
jgi:hypothetical protein